LRVVLAGVYRDIDKEDSHIPGKEEVIPFVQNSFNACNLLLVYSSVNVRSSGSEEGWMKDICHLPA
jgi:hypothetical protein